jgi:hypothetical protein
MKKTKNSGNASKAAPTALSSRQPAEISYEDAVQGPEVPRMTKVSVTVDRGLLSLVDHYVLAHQGMNRSEIFGKALEMWAKETQKQADFDCYSTKNAPESAEQAAWTAIQMEAAKYIW